MDNYGITMKGPFHIQEVGSLPGWVAADAGRQLYLTSNNKIYNGNNVGWVEEVDKLWTYQDTAPTGWSIVSGTADALMACKGGTNAYNTAGGAQAGTWTQPSHTHTGPSHTHMGGAHPLSESEMPAHSHSFQYANASFYHGGGLSSYLDVAMNTKTTGETGGGGTHSHGATSAAGTGATSSNGTASTYRPIANVGIVIERS